MTGRRAKLLFVSGILRFGRAKEVSTDEILISTNVVAAFAFH